MRIAFRTHRKYHYSAGQIIHNGGMRLLVEDRDYYTRYRLENEWGSTILDHEVRSVEPLKICPSTIIHARHIPWFMWIWYGLRNALWKARFAWQMRAHRKKENLRIQRIREMAKENMGAGRFGGRYNR